MSGPSWRGIWKPRRSCKGGPSVERESMGMLGECGSRTEYRTMGASMRTRIKSACLKQFSCRKRLYEPSFMLY